MDQGAGSSVTAAGQGAATTVSCALCGTTVPAPPITWMFEQDRSRGGRWYCQDCSRRNLRAVEAKLDQAWW